MKRAFTDGLCLSLLLLGFESGSGRRQDRLRPSGRPAARQEVPGLSFRRRTPRASSTCRAEQRSPGARVARRSYRASSTRACCGNESSSDEMPPNSPLPEGEKAVLRTWIASGAGWGTDPIDAFQTTTAAGPAATGGRFSRSSGRNPPPCATAGGCARRSIVSSSRSWKQTGSHRRRGRAPHAHSPCSASISPGCRRSRRRSTHSSTIAPGATSEWLIATWPRRSTA